MTGRSHRLGSFAAFLVGLASASAQLAPDVSRLAFATSHGWTFHPAMRDGRVVGFLASQNSGAVAPAGYSILWFSRGPGGFSMQGYSGDSLAGAARKAASASQAGTWFSRAVFAEDLGGADPEPDAALTGMPRGLAEDDPLQTVAELLTPEMMQAFIETGVAAGAAELSAAEIDESSVLEPVSAMGAVLTSLASRAENLVGSDGRDLSAATDPVAGLCIPWTTTTTMQTPAGPWTSVNPSGTPCVYSRPTTIWTITCSISITCVDTCTSTVTGTGTQTGTCPGNNSGFCPIVPPCMP